MYLLGNRKLLLWEDFFRSWFSFNSYDFFLCNCFLYSWLLRRLGLLLSFSWWYFSRVCRRFLLLLFFSWFCIFRSLSLFSYGFRLRFLFNNRLGFDFLLLGWFFRFFLINRNSSNDLFLGSNCRLCFRLFLNCTRLRSYLRFFNRLFLFGSFDYGSYDRLKIVEVLSREKMKYRIRDINAHRLLQFFLRHAFNSFLKQGKTGFCSCMTYLFSFRTGFVFRDDRFSRRNWLK